MTTMDNRGLGFRQSDVQLGFLLRSQGLDCSLSCHLVAPMHKSNYMLITQRSDLQGLNNKGGLVK